MQIIVSSEHLHTIEAHGESTYPNEGAGFLLGRMDGNSLHVEALMPVDNKREADAQFNRYELSAADSMRADTEARRQGMDVIGVFHSHPDHPARPSQFDLNHALPNFSYLITAVRHGKAEATHAWQLRGDRTAFEQDPLVVVQSTPNH